MIKGLAVLPVELINRGVELECFSNSGTYRALPFEGTAGIVPLDTLAWALASVKQTGHKNHGDRCLMIKAGSVE